MDPQSWPPIPADLMDRLNKAFPERSPRTGQTFETLMWEGGQRSVVRMLGEVFEKQNRSILTSQDHAYVPSD